jgi:hypothetical protein
VLARWLDDTGNTREWLADELGLTLRQVHRLCAGTSRPRLKTAVKIEELTGGAIRAKDWFPPAS